MKTYYDLTKQEKKKYENEFEKTPMGKTMKIRKIIMDIVLSLLVIFSFMIDLQNDTNSTTPLLYFGVFVIEIYKVYFNINFTSWLKNKYDIKRW